MELLLSSNEPRQFTRRAYQWNAITALKVTIVTIVYRKEPPPNLIPLGSTPQKQSIFYQTA